MHLKKIITVVLMASMLCTACTGKKQEKKSEEPVRAETLPSDEEADKKPDKNTAVTKDSFRSFPVSDESIFGFNVVEGGLEVSGCKRDVADKVIVVPETVNGKKVVSVGFGAFTELENVEAIVLPDSIERIGDSAFTGCEKLKYVYLGTGLKETGSPLFNWCPVLKEIEFPDGMTVMNGAAAAGCGSLESITIPASVTDIKIGIVAPDEFNGVIRTPAGSEAEKVALEYGLKTESY